MEINTQEIVTQANNALAQANSISVNNNDEFIVAASFRDALKKIEKQIDDTFDDPIDTAHKLHKSLVAQKKRHYEPLEQARTVIKAKMISFETAQEEIRRNQEDALRLAAQKRAEELAIAQAVEAERQGDKGLAQAIIEAPVVAAPVVVQKTTPKIQGFTSRTVWSATVMDMVLLVQAVAKGQVSANLLQPNETALRQFATATKGTVPIPGVRFESRKV